MRKRIIISSNASLVQEKLSTAKMDNRIKTTGNFVISLDFEINWGVWDTVKLHRYKNNLLGVNEVIPQLLKMFKKYEIHATFATVGCLFFNTKQELEEGVPSTLPGYKNPGISAYKNHMNKVGNNEIDDPFHFAPSLIQSIHVSGQEVGGQTFCHYYCLEKGQTIEEFTDDIRASKKIAEKRGIILKSLVFPRNQYNKNYLKVCKNEGFTSFRGNESSWLYRPHIHRQENFLWRFIRLLDSYINLTGHHCYHVDRKEIPVNIPSSRFLRPYSKPLSFLDVLKLKRITGSMTYAAKNALTYHLWWHPHNFGINQEKNFAFMEKILDHYLLLSKRYGFQSRSMQQLAES